MSPPRAAPAAADTCLDSPYASRQQRGGTIIDERICDLATYLIRLTTPGWFRPKRCRCGCRRLHIHSYRERQLRGTATEAAQLATVRIVVFICTRCSATWRVLPAFLARGLWRTWLVVVSVLLGSRGQHEPVIPARTRQRWLRRWANSARVLGQLLASSGSEPLRAVVQAVGLDCTRSALFDAYAKATSCREPFAALAALLHRLGAGLRLV